LTAHDAMMLHWRTNSEVRRSSRSVGVDYDTVSVSAVAGLVTALVCDTGLRAPPLAFKLLRIIARWMCATVLPILAFPVSALVGIGWSSYDVSFSTYRPTPVRRIM